MRKLHRKRDFDVTLRKRLQKYLCPFLLHTLMSSLLLVCISGLNVQNKGHRNVEDILLGRHNNTKLVRSNTVTLNGIKQKGRLRQRVFCPGGVLFQGHLLHPNAGRVDILLRLLCALRKTNEGRIPKTSADR